MYNECEIRKLLNSTISVINDSFVEEYISFLYEINLNTRYNENSILENHHILPKCYFPSLISEKENMIKLTPSDHYRAHKLLALIGDNYKLYFAFNMMKNTREENRVAVDDDYDNFKSKLRITIGDLSRGNTKFSNVHFQREMSNRRWSNPEAAKLQSTFMVENNPMMCEQSRKAVSISKIGKPNVKISGDNNPMKLDENREKFRGLSNHNNKGFFIYQKDNTKIILKDEFFIHIRNNILNCENKSSYFLSKIYNIMVNPNCNVIIKSKDKEIVERICSNYTFFSK